ncbi:MAG: hypothetical protein LKJ88_05275 [Bacilli bacterium]|jgi:hypothetical protein|nr:hypothetical protein [Bacilli bacterium]
MIYQASLFFNYQVYKDTLFIVIDNEAIPDQIVHKGDIVGLYKEKKLIGVNIFNSNNYLKLRLSGLIHNPNEPLINLINTLIKQALEEDVLLVSSPVILGQLISLTPSLLVEVSAGEKVKAGILEEDSSLKEGDYVLLSLKGSRLDNGELSSAYLKADEKYLIVGSEIGDIGDYELGSETYSLKKD